MSGIMDGNYQAISNLGGQTTNQVGQNGARTTTVKLNGTEDLGAGMSANFQFEVQPSFIAGNGNAFNTTQATAFTAVSTSTAINAAQFTSAASAQSGLVGKGMSFIGLKSGNLGEIRFGTINTATFGAWANASGLGTGIGSGYGSGNTFGDITRVESSVAYNSPTMSGFNVSVLRGVDNQAQFGVVGSTATALTLRRPEVTDLGIGYTQGPLALRYGRLQSKATDNESTAVNVGATTTTQITSAAYDAGVAKFGVLMGSHQNKGNALVLKLDNKWSLLSVTVPMGANRVIAQTGTVKINGTNASYVNGAKMTSQGIALERDLSKRTYVYYRYEKTDLAGAAAGSYVVNNAILSNWNNGSVRKINSIGISHSY
jgi:hypothetical protein